MELFPDIGVQLGQLTVVSISQHTQNDMSAWSPDVEEERESLMASVSVTRGKKFLFPLKDNFPRLRSPD